MKQRTVWKCYWFIKKLFDELTSATQSRISNMTVRMSAFVLFLGYKQQCSFDLWPILKDLEGSDRDPIKVLFRFFLAWLRKITMNFSEGSESSVRKFNHRYAKCVCVCVCVCMYVCVCVCVCVEREREIQRDKNRHSTTTSLALPLTRASYEWAGSDLSQNINLEFHRSNGRKLSKPVIVSSIWNW